MQTRDYGCFPGVTKQKKKAQIRRHEQDQHLRGGLYVGVELTPVVGVGELELLGQECRESLFGMSQMGGGTVGNSGQLG